MGSLLRYKRRPPLLAWGLGLALIGGLGCLNPLALPDAPVDREYADWNDSAVDWQPYEQGMAAAAKQGKPVVLIFYATWCPHCHNHSWLFHEPEVVEQSKSFVMIRIDGDIETALSERYNLDGEYIPRTFFLSPGGEVYPDLVGTMADFRFFLDEYDPHELLGLMERALARSRSDAP